MTSNHKVGGRAEEDGGQNYPELASSQISNDYQMNTKFIQPSRSLAKQSEPGETLVPVKRHGSSLRPTGHQSTAQPACSQKQKKGTKTKKGSKVASNFAAFGPMELKHLFDTYNGANVKDHVGGSAAGHSNNSSNPHSHPNSIPLS